MTYPNFDWTIILPEEERKKVLADRQAFFDSFPTKGEIEQAGREGRAAFARACAEVDSKKARDLFRGSLHTLLAEAVDDLGVEVVKAQLRDAAALVDTLASPMSPDFSEP